MKLCINEATCMKKSSVEEDIRLCEKYGYEYIELRIDMLKEYLEHGTFLELQSFFNTNKLSVAGYNSIEDINFRNPIQWAKIESDILFACKAKTEIGGDTLVVVPTIDNNKIYSREEVFLDSVNVLKSILRLVEPYDMKIALEPIGSEGCCIRNIEDAYAIVKEVDNENLGLVIDAFNLYLYDSWDDFEALKNLPVEKIFSYHIDDSDNLPLSILDHCHRLFPGNGVIPLDKISKILKDKGYQGVCSLELFNPTYWLLEPETVFKIGANKTKRYL